MTVETQSSPLSVEEKLRIREQQLAAVLTISNALSSKVSLSELVVECLEISLATVNAKAGSVILFDPEKEKLVFTYVVGPAKEMLTGMELDPDQGICGEVFQTGEPKITDDPMKEKRHLRRVGEQVQYETKNMVSVPLKSTDGDPIGVMQILNKEDRNFDQGDLELLTILANEAATAIENARLHEEAKLAVVVNLMGDISHDIKNLITPVTTCTQTLEMLFESLWTDLEQIRESHDSAGAEIMNEIDQATDFLRSFYKEAIDMILDGATQTQERVREIADCVKGIVAEPKFELLDANEVVDKVIKPLHLVGEKGGVTVSAELGDIAPTMIDQKQLYNAVYNLVNNAIPETPEGGSVTVITTDCREGEFPDGSYVMIQVRDTGNGMPEHVRERLFTDNAISTKPGGTGLGTRIVKNVVDAHHGTITVESEEGVGTTFTMKIPLITELPETDEQS